MGRGFLIYLAAVNLIALLAYGADKVSAKVGGRRIPERVLLGLALLGGCCGAGCGMVCFRHKIRKPGFRIIVPLALVLWTVLVILGYSGRLAGLIG